MTKTILLGMTAEEVLKKLEEATPQEAMEFDKLIDSMHNAEEIREELSAAAIAKLKEDIADFLKTLDEDKKEADEEEEVILGAFEALASGLSTFFDEMGKVMTGEEEEEEASFLVRAQMPKTNTSLVDQLKAQLEPKKSLADILREQMEPKKSLTDILREQMAANKGSDEDSITKEDILAHLIEEILEIELNSDEMVMKNDSSGYKVAIGLMFTFTCLAHDVEYVLEEKDVEKILTSVVNGLIHNGRKVEIRFEEDEVLTVIR